MPPNPAGAADDERYGSECKPVSEWEVVSEGEAVPESKPVVVEHRTVLKGGTRREGSTRRDGGTRRKGMAAHSAEAATHHSAVKATAMKAAHPAVHTPLGRSHVRGECSHGKGRGRD